MKLSLKEREWRAFLRHLNKPPRPNSKLRALLARVPVWKKKSAKQFDDHQNAVRVARKAVGDE